MLADADAVRVGHLGDSDIPRARGGQVVVVGADAGGDRQLQVPCPGDTIGGQVRGPERLRDHYVSIDELALEDAARPVLVGCHDERMPTGLQELSQAQRSADAPEQMPGCEVQPAGRRQRLSAGIVREPRYVVARVRVWISAGRI